MNAQTIKWAVIGGLGLLAYSMYADAKRAAGSVVDAVGNAAQAVNPANPENIFYGAVNDLGSLVSGDPAWNLGGWIYDTTHPNEPGI